MLSYQAIGAREAAKVVTMTASKPAIPSRLRRKKVCLMCISSSAPFQLSLIATDFAHIATRFINVHFYNFCMGCMSQYRQKGNLCQATNRSAHPLLTVSR